ncbi:TetR/AcrR family transcriptional regulator [Rhodococcus sp. D2-41]|uniref:TetR/AcrR family transcriptional regulator n=1 Tax=Speluncibacter jeojiensis TaxID=2710754 RepID=A0A9X4M502_9ACTN|nr:TetR/AcrR family transcriptional regulator [Rhodococcus sp. D2-41]MDG3009423.1 TetR/AcrR family transcriptional regulator [Rhodococcus sp. D2-41]MDG3016949.1 TetR/AcrR family transcriptional regulator [Corynebacteriales bacterium D3-21]
MSESNGKSIYGDAEARRRRTLDAAAALLDEGGYSALTIRSVAQRSGTSTGLIYQYFADKQEIFIALLNESQVESAAFVAALPRDGGVASLIAAVIPHAARQWARVGRMTATWRDIERGARSERDSVRELRVTAERYNAELRRALLEAAEAEGRRLLDDPALLRFVLSGVMGVCDTIVNKWAPDLDPTEFAEFSATVITRGITAPGVAA